MHVDFSASITADIEDSEHDLIVGAKYGYAILNRHTGRIDCLKKVWDEMDGPGKGER